MSLSRKASAVVAALALFGMPMAAHAVVSKSQGLVSQTAPSVIAFNQKLKNDQVVVTYAYLPADGYLAIFGSDKNGKRSDKALGRTELKAGDHRNVSIKLDSAPPKDSTLWASLSGETSGSFWPKTLPFENKFEIE